MVSEINRKYKKTKFGEIPSDWKVEQLDKITTLITNGFVGIASPYYSNDTDAIPYLMSNNIRENKIDLRKLTRVKSEFNDKHQKSILNEGDLLTVQSGHIGTSCVVPREFNGGNCHALIISKFKTNQGINPYYVSFYLNSPEGRKRLKPILVGSTIPHINVKDFKKLEIPIPSKDEQKKIVEIFSSVNEAINKTEAIIEQIEKVKKGLMQRLLTKGIGHTNFKQTEIGEIPEKWEVKSLGQIGTWSGGGTPSKQEPSYWSKEKQVIWVSPKDMHTEIIFSSEDYITEKGLKDKKLKLLPKGTVLFVTRSGILRKCVPIAMAAESLTINQDLKALQVSSSINNRFVFYTLLALNDSIRSSCVKTGTTVESIDFKSLQQFLIPVPPLTEQKKIVDIISVYYEKAENERAYLRYLNLIKRGLMQSLLTGRVRVKVSEVEVKQV